MSGVVPGTFAVACTCPGGRPLIGLAWVATLSVTTLEVTACEVNGRTVGVMSMRPVLPRVKAVAWDMTIGVSEKQCCALGGTCPGIGVIVMFAMCRLTHT